MNDPFLKEWFSGVNSFINESPDSVTENLLTHCAVRCSESYSLKIYKKCFDQALSLEEMLTGLSRSLPDFNYRRHSDHIDIIYSHCGCDLVEEGLLSTPKLCECSRQSLIYNWESLFGKGNVSVLEKQTVLKGADVCLFQIQINNELPHFEEKKIKNNRL